MSKSGSPKKRNKKMNVSKLLKKQDANLFSSVDKFTQIKNQLKSMQKKKVVIDNTDEDEYADMSPEDKKLMKEQDLYMYHTVLKNVPKRADGGKYYGEGMWIMPDGSIRME